MTLYEIWFVSPQSFTFVKYRDGRVEEYTGSGALDNREVANVRATSYPMFRSVLEVTLVPKAE